MERTRLDGATLPGHRTPIDGVRDIRAMLEGMRGDFMSEDQCDGAQRHVREVLVDVFDGLGYDVQELRFV